MADDAKETLHHYLRSARETLLWKLDGLSEHDVRRPLTPTGTNLLGLVKHAAGVEVGYFGDCFGRPIPDPPPWYAAMMADTAEDNVDMWAPAEESREDVLGFHARATAHADATIDALDLDATGTVEWWGDRGRAVSLHRLLVHVIADLTRHAGHADIVRELVDGSAGLRPGVSNLPGGDALWWERYRERVQEAADHFR